MLFILIPQTGSLKKHCYNSTLSLQYDLQAVIDFQFTIQFINQLIDKQTQQLNVKQIHSGHDSNLPSQRCYRSQHRGVSA